jgi:hypothetical protein
MACAVFVLNLTAAYALPKRIIILRHAEKTSGDDLCKTGKDRATAPREEYLGKNARKSLFAEGEQPAVFYATRAIPYFDNTPRFKRGPAPLIPLWARPTLIVGILSPRRWGADPQRKALENSSSEI